MTSGYIYQQELGLNQNKYNRIKKLICHTINGCRMKKS